MAISFDVSDLSKIAPLLGNLKLGQAPDSKLPDVSNLPTPAMQPPQPTPAQAGFSAYAADPFNQQKVMNSLTPPGQPIIPTSTAAPVPPMAAVTPPSPPQSNSALVPPTQTAAPIQTLAEWEAANPKSVEKPLLTGRSRGMNIFQGVTAGLIGAAGGIKGNPLAGVNYVDQMRQNDQGVDVRNNAKYQGAVIQPLQDVQARQQAAANLTHTNLENTILPEAEQIKRDAQDLKAKQQSDLLNKQYAQLGFKQDVSADGTPLHTYSPDPDSPITQSRTLKDQLVQSQVADTQAQKALRDAQTEFEKSRNDPNSPAYKLASAKLAVARQNAAAATERASAYMGRYMQSAYNVGLDGKTLAGAPIISNDSGDQAVVGTGNANTAIKNQSNAAQFNDVHGALDNLEQTATSLVKSGGSLNSPRVALALSQPAGTLHNWLQGAGVKAGLTPEERDYVISIASAHENVQALRKSAGGTATDSAVAKLDSMIPGQSTPDLDYLRKQTGQIRATAERLGKGATTATGGLTVRGQQGNSTAPPTKASGGTLPASAAAQLQEGIAHTFGNGQVWTKTNGVPKRLK
jgi:hypothetical protein